MGPSSFVVRTASGERLLVPRDADVVLSERANGLLVMTTSFFVESVEIEAMSPQSRPGRSDSGTTIGEGSPARSRVSSPGTTLPITSSTYPVVDCPGASVTGTSKGSRTKASGSENDSISTGDVEVLRKTKLSWDRHSTVSREGESAEAMDSTAEADRDADSACSLAVSSACSARPAAASPCLTRSFSALVASSAVRSVLAWLRRDWNQPIKEPIAPPTATAALIHDGTSDIVSSSVGGEGAIDGDPASSPVDGSTDPTEEDSSSDSERGVMVRRVQTRIADAADELRDRLVGAQEGRLPSLSPVREKIRASMGDDLYERAEARTDWEAARASLAAVREFMSHAAGIAVGEQSKGGLLGSVSDEVEGLGEAADLLALCRAFELGGLGGPGSHVVKGFVEGLVSGLHDDSSSVGGGAPVAPQVGSAPEPTGEASPSDMGLGWGS